MYTFNWLAAAGTLMVIAGIITALILRVPARDAVRAYGRTYVELSTAIVTVMAVLALAYVMNLSGQTTSLGTWLAGAGGIFAILSSDPGLDRRRGDRLGHLVQRPLRRPAGADGQGRRA